MPAAASPPACALLCDGYESAIRRLWPLLEKGPDGPEWERYRLRQYLWDAQADMRVTYDWCVPGRKSSSPPPESFLAAPGMPAPLVPPSPFLVLDAWKRCVARLPLARGRESDLRADCADRTA